MSDQIDPRVPDMAKREALLVHIEGLQATIQKRNETIERLQNKIAEGVNSDSALAAQRKAFRQGWKACANRLMGATSQAAAALTTINREAWREHLEAERQTHD